MQPTQDILWGVPFAGLLLSVALFPVVAPRFWQRRMAAVAFGWIVVLLVQEAVVTGPRVTAVTAWRAMLDEYLPFVTLLLGLYTAGGGILLRGGLRGTPAGNTALLALATLLGGVMGTIGASMVLIHPLLRANAHRNRKVHLVVFFIVLAGNAGGALSPLGPPLYIGFLEGVPFFWPLLHLGLPCLLLAGLELGAVLFAGLVAGAIRAAARAARRSCGCVVGSMWRWCWLWRPVSWCRGWWISAR